VKLPNNISWASHISVYGKFWFGPRERLLVLHRVRSGASNELQEDDRHRSQAVALDKQHACIPQETLNAIRIM